MIFSIVRASRLAGSRVCLAAPRAETSQLRFFSLGDTFDKKVRCHGITNTRRGGRVCYVGMDIFYGRNRVRV